MRVWLAAGEEALVIVTEASTAEAAWLRNSSSGSEQ
jgi:hypothetical protein